MDSSPLLRVSHLTVRYSLSRHEQLTAIDDVSLQLQPGETLAVVGESGCGKSTLAKAICGLLPATGGDVFLHGEALPARPQQRIRFAARHMQYIFQDPLDALDPRMTIGEILAEPLRGLNPELSAAERQRRIEQALDDVAMPEASLHRYPHEFSGGQAQRISIARALVSEPAILICDEPVSALDVSIQAQIINLLGRLQHERNLAMLFISHDLRVVQHLADQMIVLYLGKLMESGPATRLFEQPQHPYTRALLAAIPRPDPAAERERISLGSTLHGDLPSPVNPPSGCVFRTRCPEAIPACAQYQPAAGKTAAAMRVNCLVRGVG